MADNPVQLNPGTAVLTAMGGSAIGDQVGDALSNVLIWVVGLSCHCPVPPVVSGGFHTLCVFACTGLAMLTHYYFAKMKANE